MKILKFILPVLLIVFVFQFIQADAPPKKDSITWHSLDEALPLAKEQNKFIFIDFYTSWCGYCKKMDRDVFAKEEIINLLNDDFIAVKVNGDSQKILEIDGYKISERDLTKKEFRVSGYPAFHWLTPSGKKFSSVAGYKPLDFWIAAFNQVKAVEVDSTGNTIKPPTEKK